MKLDHLAVAGTNLFAAVATIETTLGVSMQSGGRHDVFGTHNALLGLDDGLYLEAIAIDPDASPPDRPRWFDLDRFSGPARLTNWICRTDDMAATRRHLGDGIGHPVALARGDLCWQMAVPQDGALPYDNLYPALIRWQSPVHPSTVLTASGCRLQRLVISHPDAADLAASLTGIFNDARVVIEQGTAGMIAEFMTPNGLRVLQ